MAQAMVDAGVPAAVSYSAGTYVCNAVLFSVLDALAASQSTARAGFVHVPNSPEQACHLAKATPSMSVALMLQGIVNGLECACSWG
jgi:pyroglutamyl-peptidase